MSLIPGYDFLPVKGDPDINEALRQISDSLRSIRGLLPVGLLIDAGAPSNDLGEDGNYYFRTDPAGAGTFIYHKSGGTWSGIV